MTDNEELKAVEANEARKSGKSMFYSIFIVMVIVSVLGAGAIISCLKMIGQQGSMITRLQSDLTENKNEMTNLQNALQDVHAATQNSQTLSAKQEQMIADWKSSQQGNLEKWYVAEAEYLVRLANDHVMFTQNTAMAMTLLQRADQVLAKLNNGNLMPIRKSLATDMASLQETPQVDVTELYLVLNALNTQIDKLPLPAGPLQPSDQEVTTPATNLPWWRAGLSKSWDVLKKIVIVRYNSGNLPPLVLPEERGFLYQNLHAQMENAMWAALHGNWRVYQMSITQARNWIAQYFIVDAPATQAMLQRMQGLQNLNVQPPKANLTPTMQLFDAYFADAGQQHLMQ